MKKLTLLLSFLIVSTCILFSQPCTVNDDSLKGTYTGDCKNEKAHGHGIATGIDTYTGDFKNGYPEGEGKYAWKNGNWYEGSFKNGKPNGKGTLHKLSDAKGTDSAIVLTGFWEKGKFVGKYEKPYNINTFTNNVSSVSVLKINGTQSELTITVKSVTGGAISLSGSAGLPKPRLVDIQMIEGRFEQQVSDESTSTINNKYIIRKITFPFYAILSFETQGQAKLPVERIGIELYENCNWGVQVTIDN